MEEKEIELIDYLSVIWNWKWMIILSTFLCMLTAGIISYLQKPVFEIDAIIEPANFLVQAAQGKSEKILVENPIQIVNKITNNTYDYTIAKELNIDISKFPKIKSENLKDTSLVRIWTKCSQTDVGKNVLSSLNNHIKNELDKKIEIEIHDVDTQIKAKEIDIKNKEIEITNLKNSIKIKKSDIKSLVIEKEKKVEENITMENKLKISEDRVAKITEEINDIRGRIGKLEKEQIKAIKGKKNERDAIGMLLYSNEIQNNLRHYNTMNEKLSAEKITQENLNLSIKINVAAVRQIDNQIENINTQIEGINNETEKMENGIANTRNEITFLKEKKGMISYTKIIKQPTSSLYPVSPRKKLNVAIACVLGFIVSTMLSFFIQYIKTSGKSA